MAGPYEVLGVNKDATIAQIRRAYRRLALKYHPDKNPEGTKQFLVITRAFELLADPFTREQYDKSGIDPKEERNQFTATADGWDAFWHKSDTMKVITPENQHILDAIERGGTVWLLVIYKVDGIESYAASQIVDAAIEGVNKQHGFVKLAGIHCNDNGDAAHMEMQQKWGVTNCKLPTLRLLANPDISDTALDEPLGYMAHMSKYLPPVLRAKMTAADLLALEEFEGEMARSKRTLEELEEAERVRRLGLSIEEKRTEEAEASVEEARAREEEEETIMIAQQQQRQKRQQQQRQQQRGGLHTPSVAALGQLQLVEVAARRARARRASVLPQPMFKLDLGLPGAHTVAVAVWDSEGDLHALAGDLAAEHGLDSAKEATILTTLVQQRSLLLPVLGRDWLSVWCERWANVMQTNPQELSVEVPEAAAVPLRVLQMVLAARRAVDEQLFRVACAHGSKGGANAWQVGRTALRQVGGLYAPELWVCGHTPIVNVHGAVDEELLASLNQRMNEQIRREVSSSIITTTTTTTTTRDVAVIAAVV
jgi:hypothetical protein